MLHKTHIKRKFSVLMVNFQQKYLRDWFQKSPLGLFFRKIVLFFLTCSMLTWLHEQIPARWKPSSLLTKKQEYATTICTVHVFGFFAPKLDLNLPNLGRIVASTAALIPTVRFATVTANIGVDSTSGGVRPSASSGAASSRACPPFGLQQS